MDKTRADFETQSDFESAAHLDLFHKAQEAGYPDLARQLLLAPSERYHFSDSLPDVAFFDNIPEDIEGNLYFFALQGKAVFLQFENIELGEELLKECQLNLIPFEFTKNKVDDVAPAIRQDKTYTRVPIFPLYSRECQDFLIKQIGFNASETLLTLFLDDKQNVVGFYETFQGTVASAPASPYQILQSALLNCKGAC